MSEDEELSDLIGRLAEDINEINQVIAEELNSALEGLTIALRDFLEILKGDEEP